jgi:hypothetical protein
MDRGSENRTSTNGVITLSQDSAERLRDAHYGIFREIGGQKLPKLDFFSLLEMTLCGPRLMTRV